ncbi:MAG: bifunctional metallophosphatase/5'-nucleotidase [Candidatus Cryptobacteroides sp.]
MKIQHLWLFIILSFLLSCNRLKEGEHILQIITTNDVHGSWFDSLYVGKKVRPSLFAVNHYVDSIRKAEGKENVLLLDAGDCLQGDNAAYYYNYVDTLSPHLFPRIAAYMQYDAITVGNHDIETGHRVYDRVKRELEINKIPFLAGNAIRNDNGRPYFPVYKIFHRAGLKIAVIGFTNPNIKAWLSENLWSGMTFKSLIPLVQQDVDKILSKEKPNVVIVSIHSGTGKGDGSMYENQGLDLFNTLKGVDFLICSHDHAAITKANENICLVNSGSHAKNIGIGTLKIKVQKGKIVSKHLDARLLPVSATMADSVMRNHFKNDYEAVKHFTRQEVGTLQSDLLTRDSYKGMCNYMNLLHTISLSCSPAQISFSAPLTYNDKITAGTLIYNDLFKIYPYENQIFVIRMSGSEIKNYLEYSYDKWINTISSPDEHLLKIVNKGDMRFNQNRWSFINRPYNFDSAGGINYTVDITKSFGSRINIISMADGAGFDTTENYFVAMTSYRANGGGELLSKGAGINTDYIENRIIGKFPEFRNLLYNYIKDMKTIDPIAIGDKRRIGQWKFIPEKTASGALEKDFYLIFE